MLLAVLVLVASLSVLGDANYLLSYRLNSDNDFLGGLGCFFAAGVDQISDHQANQRALGRPGVSAALDTCMDRFEHQLPWWPVWLELALLITTVTALYWGLPRWKGRRGKVVPLNRQVDPTDEVRRLVDELVVVAGLDRSPRFVIDPAAHTPSAVVFGRWRRYTVCLHGGLLVRRWADPAGFRAVVLHELAHIRNRDVDITYGTVALWRVFLIVLLPANVLIAVAYLRRDLPRHPSGGFAATNVPSSVYELLQAAFLTVLVYLARADVLRTREFYADADAAAWGADPRVWRHAAAAPSGVGRVRHVLVSFAGLWRTHPTWRQREHALANPVWLFDVQRLPMFLTGAAAIIVTSWASTWATMGEADVPEWGEWLSAVLGAGLATVIVGIILWRAAAHAVLTGQRSPSGIRAGLWFGAGLVSGEVVLGRTSNQWLPERPQFLLILLLIGIVICWWTAQHAELWTRTWRGRTLRPVAALSLTATWLVFGLWFSWWQSDGYQWADGRSTVNSAGVLQLYATEYPGLAEAESDTLNTVVAVHWVLGRVGTDLFVLSSEQLVLWAAAALWLLPLLTCLWHRRPASTAPRWAQAVHVPPAPGLPMRRIVRCGFGGGLLALCALGMARALVHGAVRPGPGWLPATVLHNSLGAVVAITGAMVVAAWIAGVRGDAYRLLTGLAAAGLTALAGLAWTFLLASADGCLGELNTGFAACEWRPHDGWSTAAETGMTVLGLGIFAVAATMLLIPRVPRRSAPPTNARDTSVVRRRFLVITVWATTLAFGSTSGLALTEVSSPTPDGTTPTQADLPVATSSSMHSVRVLSWLKYGGRDHLNGIAEDENAFHTVAAQAATHADVTARVRPVCRDIERGVLKARAYFPVPDKQGHAHWTKFLDQSEQAAVTCRRAIDTGNLALYRTAGEKVQQTFFSHRSVNNWLDTFMS
ncbi:M48 family metalloprotease [Streptomyces buecherae]|uniref:M48 family metalloprotease n=1 Tax=Streptomyces buecherae TaxID=2763006 RepID=A0A7H8NGQ0_9ACTN|nr:M48 family metalloprotease [Streptomyces buecherae]QKW53641.1 M48 family metalloprotease [Streptomyces buecherae]